MAAAVHSSAWERLSGLPLVVESCEYEGLSARLSADYERITTRIRLGGGGSEGLGEDVSPVDRDDATPLHLTEPALPLAGEWTLGTFCARLAEVDQWPVAPAWDVARRWRNWAFEAAALDLALNQMGIPLHEAVGRTPAPVRYVHSLGLGEPPTFDRIRRRLERYAGLRFKLDVTPDWTPDLIAEVAATGAVEIVDFKGHYGRERGELPVLVAMYEQVVAAFPDALLEDAHDVPEIAARLEPEIRRISYDAPIHSVDDLDSTPLPPRALNIKPCRVGDLRSLLDVYAACEARGLLMYGGGMAELDVGRDQIQLLAALFHPDAPNDVAPTGFHVDPPAAGLALSPLAACPAPTGFRRAA